MKASLSELLARIPGSPSPQSPAAERFAQGFSHGSMSAGLYAPLDTDPQQPTSAMSSTSFKPALANWLLRESGTPSWRAMRSLWARASSIASRISLRVFPPG
jgi:hypothetical protein